MFNLFFMGPIGKYILTVSSLPLEVPKSAFIVSIQSKKDEGSFLEGENHRKWLKDNRDKISIWKIYISNKICTYRLSGYVRQKILLLCLPRPNSNKFDIIELFTLDDSTIVIFKNGQIEAKSFSEAPPVGAPLIDIQQVHL